MTHSYRAILAAQKYRKADTCGNNWRIQRTLAVAQWLGWDFNEIPESIEELDEIEGDKIREVAKKYLFYRQVHSDCIDARR